MKMSLKMHYSNVDIDRRDHCQGLLLIYRGACPTGRRASPFIANAAENMIEQRRTGQRARGATTVIFFSDISASRVALFERLNRRALEYSARSR